MIRIRALSALASLMLFASMAHADAVPVDDKWADLRFLIGDWDTQPDPSIKSGQFTLHEDLNGSVLVRHNHAEYAPQPGEEQGIVHDDLMIVYRENGVQRATYVDAEGHVIHYAILPGTKQVTFESDPVPNQPRYKLIYKEEKKDLVSVVFWIAPPGGEYSTYVAGKVKRREHS